MRVGAHGFSSTRDPVTQGVAPPVALSEIPVTPHRNECVEVKDGWKHLHVKSLVIWWTCDLTVNLKVVL